MTKKNFHRKLFYPIKFYQELPPFASHHNQDYDSDYYRCFCIDYKMFEFNSFNNSFGWYLRFKPFLIPKIRNNILKFLFGTRMFYIRTEHDKDFVTFSEDLTKKEANDRVNFEQDEYTITNMYFSQIQYSGFLFKSKKEQKSFDSIRKMFLAIHS